MPISKCPFGRWHSTLGNLKSLSVAGIALLLAGCNTDMWRQPKLAPMEAMDSGLFVDGASARPLVPGTVSRGHLREDQAFYTGIENGKYMDRLPIPVTRELLDRGRERFDVFCSPCHGRLGDGQGMIAHRGLELRRPVGNYQTDRLRKMPVGYFYDVMTNGYGAMYSYASRVEPRDRWAIASYIRALQLSQHAPAQVAGSGLTGGQASGLAREQVGSTPTNSSTFEPDGPSTSSPVAPSSRMPENP